MDVDPDPAVVVRDDARLADAIEIAAWRDMYAAPPPPLKRALGLDVLTIADATVLIARGIPMAMFNRAIGLGNDVQASEADLDCVVATLAARCGPTTWIQHGPASGVPEIAGWLEKRDLHPAPRAWLKLLRGPEPTAPVESGAFDVREIHAEHAHVFAKTLADAHGMPAGLAAWTEHLVGRKAPERRERWHAIAAFEGDVLIAGGMLFITGDHAWLGLGGTLAAFRNRGAQAAIVARRLDLAIAAGCTQVASETGEHFEGERAPSYENLMRAGFRIVARRTNYERPLPDRRSEK